MKKKYLSPEITIYVTEITHALMDVSGSVGQGGGLDNQGGAGDSDEETATAKKHFNIWDE